MEGEWPEKERQSDSLKTVIIYNYTRPNPSSLAIPPPRLPQIKSSNETVRPGLRRFSLCGPAERLGYITYTVVSHTRHQTPYHL